MACCSTQSRAERTKMTLNQARTARCSALASWSYQWDAMDWWKKRVSNNAFPDINRAVLTSWRCIQGSTRRRSASAPPAGCPVRGPLAAQTAGSTAFHSSVLGTWTFCTKQRSPRRSVCGSCCAARKPRQTQAWHRLPPSLLEQRDARGQTQQMRLLAGWADRAGWLTVGAGPCGPGANPWSRHNCLKKGVRSKQTAHMAQKTYNACRKSKTSRIPLSVVM